jgi:acyl-CoA dehydrogenase
VVWSAPNNLGGWDYVIWMRAYASDRGIMIGADAVLAPYLTAEHGEFRGYVKSALGTCILPHADEWERQGGIPRSLWRELADFGLLGIGHIGADFLRSAILLEELGRTGYAGVRAAVAVHSYMASSYLELFGTDIQKSRYLSATREGSLIAGLAISEGSGGSDLRHIGTRARRHPGGYILSGEKSYVTNGSKADLLVVLAITKQRAAGKALSGATMFLVDMNADGVSRCPQALLGWRSADIARVRFNEVDVADDRVLGRADHAFGYVMRALDFERVVAGFLALGGAGHCLALLKSVVAQRQIKDRPLSSSAAIRHEVASLVSEYHVVRQYAYHVAWLQSIGGLDTQSASILKLKCTELAVAASQRFLQYQGAQGYLADSAGARIYCDAAGGTIAGGASEIVREMIFELA